MDLVIITLLLMCFVKNRRSSTCCSIIIYTAAILVSIRRPQVTPAQTDRQTDIGPPFIIQLEIYPETGIRTQWEWEEAVWKIDAYPLVTHHLPVPPSESKIYILKQCASRCY